MENVIRNLVKEEVQKAAQNGTDNTSPSTRESQLSEIPSSTGKSKKVQTRLSNLLTKIRKKSESKVNVTKQKDLKVQVRWLRDSSGKIQVVKPGDGGGARFILFDKEDDPDPDFGSLLQKCLDLYFPNNINQFEEEVENVDACIEDYSHNEMSLTDCTIRDFMTQKGLFPSRTWFFLNTSKKGMSQECSSVGSDVPIDRKESENNITTISNKRKICVTCHATYFNFCLICKQNEEFNLSLKNDITKGQEENPKEEKPQNENIHKVNPQEGSSQEELNINDLRQRRLDAILGNSRIEDHNMASTSSYENYVNILSDEDSDFESNEPDQTNSYFMTDSCEKSQDTVTSLLENFINDNMVSCDDDQWGDQKVKMVINGSAIYDSLVRALKRKTGVEFNS